MGGSAVRTRAAGLTKADQILARTHSDLIVSKQNFVRLMVWRSSGFSVRKANRICGFSPRPSSFAASRSAIATGTAHL